MSSLLLENISTFFRQGWRKILMIIIAIWLISCATIVVHESGHLLAARLLGIRVSEFSIGQGPVLFKFTSSDNLLYSFRAFPIRGFVLCPFSTNYNDVNSLENRPVFDRMTVYSAGSAANAIFAYIIVLVQVLHVGFSERQVLPGVVVLKVTPISAASRDGLLPGDVILGVNNTELTAITERISRQPSLLVSQVINIVKRNPKNSVLFKIRKEGNSKNRICREVDVTPDDDGDHNGRIGVQLIPNIKYSKTRRPKNLLQAFGFSWRQLGDLASLAKFICPYKMDNCTSIASFAALGTKFVQCNTNALYFFVAFFNIVLAALNILPVPSIDGGYLALHALEAARGGRKLPYRLENLIDWLGSRFLLYSVIFGLIHVTLDLLFSTTSDDEKKDEWSC